MNNNIYWKTIKYANKYEVSNLGTIRNKNTDRELKINYKRLKLNNKRARPGLINNLGKNKGYYLHRIVAQHFIPNPDNLPEVNHIDGNFYNNCVLNLEWVSKKTNMEHANENNLINRYTRKVILKNKNTGEINIFDKVTDCAKYLGTSIGTISQTCRGKRIDKKYIMSYCHSEQNKDNDESNVIWKEYPECNKYLVSNTGQIKNKKTGRIMMGSKVNGYRFVNLFIDKDTPKMNRLVHRMVAITYLENPDNKQVVNHKDTRIINNHVDNLEWVTYKENMNTFETKKNLMRGKNSKQILQIDIENKKIINSFYGAKEGESLCKINSSCILKICNYWSQNKTYSGTFKTYKKKYIFVFEEYFKDSNLCLEDICTESFNSKRPLAKPITQYTKKLEKIREFSSGYEASKELNINYSGICQVCNFYKYNDIDRPKCYKLKSYKQYIFKYS